jgi:hypothetical protein
LIDILGTGSRTRTRIYIFEELDPELDFPVPLMCGTGIGSEPKLEPKSDFFCEKLELELDSQFDLSVNWNRSNLYFRARTGGSS